MTKLRSVLSTASMLTLSASLIACGGDGSKPAATASTSEARVITADGSSTVFLITEAVAEEFQKANAGTRVTVGSSGTGGGFQKFCRDETDLSNASRPIKSAEAEACAKAGIEFIELPIAYDGLAIVVNPKNTWVTSMTVADLKKLWEPAAQGQVKRWKQIRPEWPDQEIHLFGAGVDSGTFDYFTEAIVGKEGQSRGDYTSSEDDNVIVQGVSGDANALGYFGYAYYEQNKDKLKVVPIDDGDSSQWRGPDRAVTGNGGQRNLSPAVARRSSSTPRSRRSTGRRSRHSSTSTSTRVRRWCAKSVTFRCTPRNRSWCGRGSRRARPARCTPARTATAR